jgi:hypothetical protein
MPYSSDIAKILDDQIAKFVTLNRHQLVGHVANLDFWLAEVRHCLDVIDGYEPRFERLKAAQTEYVAEHRTVEFDLRDPRHTQGPAAPPRRVSDAELRETRRSLCGVTYRFLVRCFNEDFIDEAALRWECDQLGIGVEATDLRRRSR